MTIAFFVAVIFGFLCLRASQLKYTIEKSADGRGAPRPKYVEQDIYGYVHSLKYIR